MKLSILICHVPSRKHLLDRLMSCLNPQIEKFPGDVEILIDPEDIGAPIGKKRNNLIDRSSGNYICFIDDDDLVCENYVQLILSAIDKNPDVIGMEGIYTQDGRNPKKFIHSLRYNRWFEENGIYYRMPNHLNPVKKEIASSVKFKEISFGEDRDYSERIMSLLKSEEYITEPLYYYLYVSKKKMI